jgi:hypothetical protein
LIGVQIILALYDSRTIEFIWFLTYYTLIERLLILNVFAYKAVVQLALLLVHE